MGRPFDIVHIYRRLNDPIGTPSDRSWLAGGKYLLISWAGGDTRAMANGSLNAAIRQRAREVASLKAPVFFEFRWEMDRPNLSSVVHGPSQFIRAWRTTRRVFAAAGASNASWVWCPTAGGFDDGRAQQYYPGNRQVDWVCADVYPRKAYIAGTYESFESASKSFLNWAAGHGHPIMIGEFGVPRSFGGRRGPWLDKAARIVRSLPQIKAVLYFDSDTPGSKPFAQFGFNGDQAAEAAMQRNFAASYFRRKGMR